MQDDPITGIGAWVTRPMFFTFAVLLTLPLWIDRVGLYHYLALKLSSG